MTLEAIFIVIAVFILGYATARVVDAFRDDDDTLHDPENDGIL